MNFLLFFITLAPISLMPGINMTYAMSVGMSFGYKHSFFVMAGQLLAIAFVSFSCMLGVGAVLHHFEYAFKALNIIAGLYMLYLGVMLFFGKGELSITNVSNLPSKKQMFINGLIVSVSNPKAWIFFSALLPTFLDKDDPFSLTRMCVITVTLVFIEFLALNIYALGGAMLKKFLQTHLRLLEICTAIIVCTIGVLLLFR
ncbi:Putative threonine efflux protein [Campylobacter concisus UNSW3]|uniref:Putative threonine efflux protein n=1 Tax=Campylobacter concisus UNSW3 TaxID=1242966 RepID=U2EXD7_9BACT|nr:LysE family translocator [Campylobacter concisus]ERJ22325.1 Putative threonine efflux protein [Campylobacter concisus UNSW3]